MISNPIARRVIEIIAGIALIVAIFVWPRGRTGWTVQIVSAVVGFGCLVVLKKGPSI